MEIPGHFYQRDGRWWWRVRLSGEKKHKNIPLKAAGAKYATKEKKLAEQVAKMYWQKALRGPENKQTDTINTVADLAKTYLDHAKKYYHPPSQEPQRICCPAHGDKLNYWNPINGFCW